MRITYVRRRLRQLSAQISWRLHLHRLSWLTQQRNRRLGTPGSALAAFSLGPKSALAALGILVIAFALWAGLTPSNAPTAESNNALPSARLVQISSIAPPRTSVIPAAPQEALAKPAKPADPALQTVSTQLDKDSAPVVDETNWKNDWKQTTFKRWAIDSKNMSAQQMAVTRYLADKYPVPEKVMAILVKNAWKEGQKVRIPPTLILAITAKESSFNPLARSPVGAEGLMQVMTNIHREKFAKLGGPQAAFDPLANMKVGTRILYEYIQRTGSIGMALKHYVGAALHGRDGGYAQKVHAEYSRLNEVAGLPTLDLYAAYGKYDPFAEIRNLDAAWRDQAFATPSLSLANFNLKKPAGNSAQSSDLAAQTTIEETKNKSSLRSPEAYAVGQKQLTPSAGLNPTGLDATHPEFKSKQKPEVELPIEKLEAMSVSAAEQHPSYPYRAPRKTRPLS